jgi:hypothetical protein
MTRSLGSGVLLGLVFLLIVGVTGPKAQVSVSRGWNVLSARLSVSGTAPTLSSCGTGTLATGSNDTVGRLTATGATACTVTFSASFGGNSADCVIANMTANRGNVSAASSTAFTVSNLTAGDVVVYLCVGR